MLMEKGLERELPNGHYVESQKASFVYWFDNGSQVSYVWILPPHVDNIFLAIRA